MTFFKERKETKEKKLNANTFIETVWSMENQEEIIPENKAEDLVELEPSVENMINKK